jgi:transcriptional regulator with XRE-family HTH domain
MSKSIFSDWQECLQKLLRETREKAGLTQAQLAKRLGRRQTFVSKYELGERRLDLVEMVLICKAMKIPFGKFAREFEKRCWTNATIPIVDRRNDNGPDSK